MYPEVKVPALPACLVSIPTYFISSAIFSTLDARDISLLYCRALAYQLHRSDQELNAPPTDDERTNEIRSTIY